MELEQIACYETAAQVSARLSRRRILEMLAGGAVLIGGSKNQLQSKGHASLFEGATGRGEASGCSGKSARVESS